MVVLIILIALVLAAPYVYQANRKDNTINFNDFDKAATILGKAKDTTQSKYSPVKSLKNITAGSNANDLPANYHYTKKAAPGEIIEINTADSARLTMIRGIGPSFARRITRYRERLGGFYNKEQLKEVFGIDAAKYAEIEEGIAVDGRHIIKLNVNTATFDQLRRFPYLSFKQMNAILEYHNQHGDYESVADLKNIAILDDRILRKIEPYLVFK